MSMTGVGDRIMEVDNSRDSFMDMKSQDSAAAVTTGPGDLPAECEMERSRDGFPVVPRPDSDARDGFNVNIEDISSRRPFNRRNDNDGYVSTDDEDSACEKNDTDVQLGKFMKIRKIFDDSAGPSRQSDDGKSDDDKTKGKKSHRRGKNKAGKKHRVWKPYHKMSWDERRKLDERETKRATEKREQQFAAGQPMAPYNTTQFLMEQHDGEPGFETPQNKADLSGSMESSEPDSAVDDDTNGPDIFGEREFAETYADCHAERLQGLSKDDLVREFIQLEQHVDRLERRLRASTESGGSRSPGPAQDQSAVVSPPPTAAHALQPAQNGHLPAQADQPTVPELLTEVERLRAENEQLQKERNALAARISDLVQQP